jgi:hypothetical protein
MSSSYSDAQATSFGLAFFIGVPDLGRNNYSETSK